MSLSRRQFLQTLGLLGIMRSLNSTDIITLERAILDAIGSQEIGVDIRQLDDQQQVAFRIMHNQDKLYPVASAFKAFLLYYYFWNVPQAEWKTDRDSDPYRVGVFSDNVATGFLIRDVGRYVDIYGNATEKLNDCLLFNVGLTNGIYTWDWEGSPVTGFNDQRFAPTEDRYIDLRGVAHSADNLFTAADLATGYTFLAQAAAGTLPPNPKNPFFDTERAQIAATATLDLLAIPAANYQSPIERAGLVYIGKDGILPKGDLTVGNVVDDAGITTIDETTYVLSFMSASQSEFAAVNTLTAIVNSILEIGV